MTPERWQQVKELFHAALEREPKFRADFLVRACGADPALRAEVESLISSHEEEGSFIDSPAYQAVAETLAADGAELKPGARLAQYEVLSLLGAGGMGQVYLAQDTRLGRKVALKLLPASFTQKPDRLRRFEQEARSASSLNHPNIITIHEIGRLDSLHFIATEFIEGETLRQYLRRAQPDMDETLRIAVQIADALAAAHKAGIVHRDIKPENVMLRPDGYVKVLDFGLAKLAAPQAARDSDPEAPTLARVQTNPGVVMGTINYMSPEQARGLEVDARTDIWSLGVVLYECATGHEPFAGATQSDTLAQILQTEPPPLAQHAPDVPAELERIVAKALRKDREERYQTVKDMLLDLKNLKQELEFAAKLERSVAPGLRPANAPGGEREAQQTADAGARTDESRRAATTTGVRPREHTRGRRRLALVALAALGLSLVGALALYKFASVRRRAMHFQTVRLTRLTNSGKAIHTAISPDGRYFVYVLSDAGRQSLWLRQVSAANDTQIVPPEANAGYFGVTFSRDGNDLYYAIKRNDPGTLYRLPVLGGTPVKLLQGIDSPVSFSPDGKRFAFVRGGYPHPGESGIFIANADGTGERALVVRKPPDAFAPIFFTGPSWSPDGELVACAMQTIGVGARVLAVRVADGGEQVLTPQTWWYVGRVEWLADMSGLVMIAQNQESNGPQIWSLAYPDGAAHRVTNDLNFYRALSMTADGSKLATIQAGSIYSLWLAPAGDAARAVELPTGNIGALASGDDNVAWTPDGRIVYATKTSANGLPEIWITDAAGGNRKQLTNGGVNRSPAVSPDGRYVVFVSNRTGKRNLWRMDVDGNNQTRLTDGLADFSPVVSPDGQWVVYTSLSGGRLTLWRVALAGGPPVEIKDTGASVPAVSPDGKLIAYLYADGPQTPDAPPSKLAVVPFAGGEPVKTFDLPAANGIIWTTLRWAQDGRALLYTVNKGNVTNIWSQPLDGGPPRQVTDFKDNLMATFAWSPDGKQLVCSRGTPLRDAVLVSDAAH